MHNPTAYLGLLTPALAVFLSSQAPSWAATTSPALAPPSLQESGSAEKGAAEIQRALDLRNASGKDWEAGNFRRAVLKLEEALEIYIDANAASGDEAGFVKERAVTLRALVWNTLRAGDQPAGLKYFENLIDLAHSRPAAAAQKPSAYSAIRQEAGVKTSLDEALALWKSVSDIYEAYGDKERLAQILMDRANSYAAFGEVEMARQDLSNSIQAHAAIKDFDGANWSRNDLGYSFIESEQWAGAILPLGEALAETRAGRGLAAQSALGYNLLKLAKGAVEGERPGREVVDGLWAIAEEEARGQKPAIVAPERLLVAAMQTEVARVGAKRAKGAADRLLKALPGAPAALRTDLTLHAAELLLDGGAAQEASDLLDAIQISDGSVSAHLRVRRSVLAAAASSALGHQRSFERSVSQAVDDIEALDHRPTTREAYERLVAAADSFPKSSESRAVQASWKKLKSMGGIGGAGGSSLSGTAGPNAEAIHALGEQAPLFAISAREGELVVKDLLSGDEVTRPFDWTVRTVAFHGMTMELFGGYVAVVGMNYGKAGTIKGSRASLSLNDMDNFRPLDEGIVLYVTKTGATLYGEAAK